MPSPPEPVDLDRLLQLWRAPPKPSSSPPPAGAPPPRDPVDPLAALAALEQALAQAFGETSKEFAIAGDLLEDGPDVKPMTKPADAKKVGDLVRAIFGSHAAISAEERAACRKRLPAALDRLEDVLDGLMLAVEARR